jgi:hypothetical protein
MSEWKQYRRKGVIELRPYVPGEEKGLDWTVSVSVTDSLEVGGMVARNPVDPSDQWYVNKEYFEKNYEENPEGGE